MVEKQNLPGSSRQENASDAQVKAEQILAIARQNQLPIRDDPILAQALSQVDLNQVIPEDLYAVLAEVFSFVYRLRQKNTEG